jgi:hypothetical protein
MESDAFDLAALQGAARSIEKQHMSAGNDAKSRHKDGSRQPMHKGVHRNCLLDLVLPVAAYETSRVVVCILDRPEDLTSDPGHTTSGKDVVEVDRYRIHTQDAQYHSSCLT